MMNDSYERSYYEIALTNSQVLSALAVLLLCLLTSFVAGMWVAREAVGPAAVRVAEAVPEEKAAAEGEDAEFRFFRRLGDGTGEKARRDADPSAKASTANASTAKATAPKPTATRNARDGGVARKVSPVEVGGQSQAQTQTPVQNPPVRRAGARIADRPEQPAKQPVKRPTEQPTRQPEGSPAESAPIVARQAGNTARPASTAPTTPLATDSEKIADREPRIGQMMVVQVLSSADQEKAGKVVVQLKDSGYRAFLSPALVEGRTMYRVRVGPYSDRALAEQASEKIKSQFRLNTWITARG